MQTGPERSFWIIAGLERPRPAFAPRRSGDMLHRIGSIVLALAWTWMFVAGMVTVARLEQLELSPWGSVQAAALIVGPGAAGIVLALVLEMLARRGRR
jgi:hypothetical protein